MTWVTMADVVLPELLGTVRFVTTAERLTSVIATIAELGTVSVVVKGSGLDRVTGSVIFPLLVMVK